MVSVCAWQSSVRRPRATPTATSSSATRRPAPTRRRSCAPAPGRTQPAPEHHRPPLQHPRTPAHPPPPVPAPAGQGLRPGRPRRQRPRQMPRWHAAPPGQLLLRHRVEQHLTARPSAVFVLHPVRRPPLSGQIRGVQPVRRRHPMHKRPRRLTHHGHHPQDCLHRTASPLATRPDGVPQYPRGTGRPIPVHGERALLVPGTGRSGRRTRRLVPAPAERTAPHSGNARRRPDSGPGWKGVLKCSATTICRGSVVVADGTA